MILQCGVVETALSGNESPSLLQTLNQNTNDEDDPVEDVVNQSGFESSVRGFKQTEFFNEMNSLFNEMSHFENEFNINPDESRFPGIESGFDAGLSELDGFDPILAAPESSDADFEIFRAPDKDDAPIVATENDDSEAQLEVLDILGKLKVMIFWFTESIEKALVNQVAPSQFPLLNLKSILVKLVW